MHRSNSLCVPAALNAAGLLQYARPARSPTATLSTFDLQDSRGGWQSSSTSAGTSGSPELLVDLNMWWPDLERLPLLPPVQRQQARRLHRILVLQWKAVGDEGWTDSIRGDMNRVSLPQRQIAVFRNRTSQWVFHSFGARGSRGVEERGKACSESGRALLLHSVVQIVCAGAYRGTQQGSTLPKAESTGFRHRSARRPAACQLQAMQTGKRQLELLFPVNA